MKNTSKIIFIIIFFVNYIFASDYLTIADTSWIMKQQLRNSKKNVDKGLYEQLAEYMLDTTKTLNDKTQELIDFINKEINKKGE